jgi:hypothetical protein
MEQNYRITIFTAEGVIEGNFYKKEIAISTIVEFKKRYDDFIIGIVSEKIYGKWNTICSISNGRNKIIHNI